MDVIFYIITLDQRRSFSDINKRNFVNLCIIEITGFCIRENIRYMTTIYFLFIMFIM